MPNMINQKTALNIIFKRRPFLFIYVNLRIWQREVFIFIYFFFFRWNIGSWWKLILKNGFIIKCDCRGLYWNSNNNILVGLQTLRVYSFRFVQVEILTATQTTAEMEEKKVGKNETRESVIVVVGWPNVGPLEG